MKSHKIIALVAVTAILLGCVHQLRTADKPEYVQESYTVHSGDTLWDLSAEYCDKDQDRREWIADVSKLNGDSVIKAGEEITILVKENENGE